MKITMTLLMLLVLFLPTTYPQDYTQLNLPEGAVARLGKGRLRQILYSPDGTRFAILSSIGVWLYDTETYREIALLAGHTRELEDAAFSPDGRALAGGRWDNAVQVRDAKTGDLKWTRTRHKAMVSSVAFSPDGRLLASGSWDKTVRVWAAKTGEHKGALADHPARVTSIAFSPNENHLASACGDGTVYLCW
jgi:WD40 repeat protein